MAAEIEVGTILFLNQPDQQVLPVNLQETLSKLASAGGVCREV